MLKKEFEFILHDEMSYSHGGNANICAKKLLLRAPTTKLISLASRLHSLVMSAMFNAREKFSSDKSSSNNQKQDTEFDGEGLFMFVSGALSSDQVEKLVDNFNELILSPNICLIDGKEQLTSYVLENLDAREMQRLIGDYIANFLLPSVTNQSTKKK
jgi:hypothetical protein